MLCTSLSYYLHYNFLCRFRIFFIEFRDIYPLLFCNIIYSHDFLHDLSAVRKLDIGFTVLATIVVLRILVENHVRC